MYKILQYFKGENGIVKGIVKRFLSTVPLAEVERKVRGCGRWRKMLSFRISNGLR